VVGGLTRLGVMAGERGGEFRSEDDGVAVLARGEPFADPGLGFFVLVVVCAGGKGLTCHAHDNWNVMTYVSMKLPPWS
jgi:hypothetical protein